MPASSKPFVPSMGVKNVQDTENASLAYVNVKRDGWCCSVAKGCPNNCTSPDHGRCVGTHCACMPGWSGADCSFSTTVKCPEGCNGHGIARLVLQNVIVNRATKDQPALKALVAPSSKTRHALAGSKYGRCFCAPGREQFQIVEHRRNALVMITEICALELVYV